MTEWIISDTHFNHKNIIDYCRRPFINVLEMNTAMVTRWMGAVGPKDIIYHLGDVGYLEGNQALKSDPAETRNIIQQLPGTKVLIRGNHDKNPEAMRRMGFDVVVEEMFIRCDGKVFRLIHKPQRLQGPCDYILHGHIHNTTPEERAEHEHKGELVHIPPFNINMSVEMWNYTPVSLRWLVKELARRQRDKNKQQNLRMS
jgi:calcineurin-like phosphoesterase family protein